MSEKNLKIAKNTIFLYIRMGISMIVSLYTSRVVLNALGVEDFGIWGVIGGLVAMFLFLNNALSSSTSRFLTFSLGKGDKKELSEIFNASLIIHLFVAVIVIFLCETIGVWFLNHKMVIPENRMFAAHVVFHFSVVISALSIVLVPFNSMIIAHERMNIFAYLTISDTLFKLLIAWLLLTFTSNRVIYYAVMMFIVSFINALFYFIYCRRRFTEIKFQIIKDTRLYKSLTSFTTWSLFGNLAYVGYTQGLNLLLNIFFGPVVNAARAISSQVEQTIRTFTLNFQTAINPQIIKSYAQRDFEDMHKLIFASSKYSFFLLLILSMPVMLETEQILIIWLKNVPEYTPSFIRIMLLIIMMETMSNSIMTSVTATGNIKVYHSVVGTILLLIVPISYLVLKLGGTPLSVFYVYLIIEVLACMARILIVRPMIKLSIKKYLNKVVYVSTRVGILSCILPLVLLFLLEGNVYRFILVTLSSLLSSFGAIYYWGLSIEERHFVNIKVRNVVTKLKK